MWYKATPPYPHQHYMSGLCCAAINTVLLLLVLFLKIGGILNTVLHPEDIGMGYTILRSRMYRGKKPSRRRCLCLCDCGVKFFAYATHLNTKNTTSCGCQRNTRIGRKPTPYAAAYSMKQHPLHNLYRRWSGLLARCLSPNNKSYANYGGRGITVCERWLNFENFYADMGEPPAGYSLDRTNNDLAYSPENCRWATAKEQRANQRERPTKYKIRPTTNFLKNPKYPYV